MADDGAPTSEDEIPEDELDLQLTADVYDAVIAASFGGVVVSLPLEQQKGHKHPKGRTVAIHPVLVFGIASVLFFIQCTCLTCLILDIDFEKKWSTDSWKEFDETPGRRILLCSKMLMVIVLQMICIKEFLSAMKPLAFICNPITWEEVLRPGGFGLFHASLCIPFCFMAQCMQLIIAYFVATSSMTIILQSQKVTEVVFNGLVITFLTDLDEYMFAAASAVFHVDTRKYDLFKFKLTNETRVNENRIAAIKDAASSPWHSLKSWQIYRYRGRGGKVQLIENVLIFCFLGCMFFRQTMVFTQAIETGVLPLKRDFCTLYRGLDGFKTETVSDKGVTGVKGDTAGAVAVYVMDHLTLLNYRHSLENCAKRFNLDDCYDDSMKPLCLHETLVKYFQTFPKYLTVASVLLFGTFFVPQILYANQIKILDKFEKMFPTPEDISTTYQPLSDAETAKPA